MEDNRLAPSGELGAAGLSQFATPDMARGNSVDSSRVVTHGSTLVNDPTTGAAGAVLASQPSNGMEPSARMPGYIPRALGDEAHLHGNSAGAQEHAFVPQQHGFPPGFHRPMAQPAPQRHGTFGAQPHIMPNSPVSGFSYVPYQPAQPDQRYDVLLQRIAGLENAVGQLQATCSQLSARDAALLQRVGGMVAMECASQMASLEEKVDEMGSDIAGVSSKRTAALSRPPSRKSAHSYSPKPSSSPSVIDYSEEGEDDAS